MKKIAFIAAMILLSFAVSCATGDTQKEITANTGAIDIQLIFPGTDSGPDSISNPLTCPTCKCPTCTRIDFRVTGPGMSQMDFREIDYSLLAFTLTNIPLGANRLVQCWVYDTENPLSEAAALYQGSFLVASLAANTPSSAPIVLETEAGDWFVDGGVTASGSGKSWATAFKTIQESINVAQPGDNIFVKEGTYTHGKTTPLIVMRDGVDLYGGFQGSEDTVTDRPDPNLFPTILDGENRIKTMIVGSSDARLDGFKIIDTAVATKDSMAVSMHIDGQFDLVIEDCVFEANNSTAIFLNNFSVVYIANSQFIDNTTTILAASISLSTLSSATIRNCLFSGNVASGGGVGGGAIRVFDSSLDIADSSMIDNRATDYTAAGGGGIYLYASDFQVNNCYFGGNMSTSFVGGGILVDKSSGSITNCTFKANYGEYGGGAIMVQASDNLLISNCLFYSNGTFSSGGALKLGDLGWPEPGLETITNCTFHGNIASYKGGVASNDCHIATFTDCIFWGNKAGTSDDQIFLGTGFTTVNYSDVQDGWTGTGSNNINSDPLFINAPSLVDMVVSATTTTSVVTTGIINYSIGDIIEVGDDGVQRTVQTFISPTLTFTPPFPAIPAAKTPIFKWGSVTNLTEDFHLSQNPPQTGITNSCVDAGSAQAVTLGMDAYTTRTDNIGDSGIVDMGYHYPIP